jgi:hypothetical protein
MEVIPMSSIKLVKIRHNSRRGERTRATRFANRVTEFCEWYLQPGQRRASEVRQWVQHLKKRAERARWRP